ncbi:hypothetical protein CPB86DRAFT_247896 [Serendipita vermifera]|nr:hypothetical protein CPB86DRAFT_247896 [Serendipita vermifera]
MLFPTTLILGFLSIAPAFSIPILTVRSDALAARNGPLLEARSDLASLGVDMMERRDITGVLKQFVVRSPEPEPEPLPMPLPYTQLEIEDMERRGLFGLAFRAVKGIVKLVHHIKNRHHKRSKVEEMVKRGDAVEQVEQRDLSNPEVEARSLPLEPRSSLGERIKNFFHKVGHGIVHAVKTVAKWVLRRNEEGASLEARSSEALELETREVDQSEIEARSFDEPDIEARSFDELELEVRSFDGPEVEARDFNEEEIDIRALDEPDIETRASEEGF